ncbi:hypothetical protein J1N35_027831, partial [Gossypium stocksii]
MVGPASSEIDFRFKESVFCSVEIIYLCDFGIFSRLEVLRNDGRQYDPICKCTGYPICIPTQNKQFQ